MSPELLNPELFGLKESRPTKQSDCYALGMVLYEVLSGQIPFTPSTAPVVIRMVLEGERPGRPQGDEGSLFTDAIWGVLERCWKPRPSDRTRVEAVLLSLGGDPCSSRLTCSSMGEDLEVVPVDRSDSTTKGSGMFLSTSPGLASNCPSGKQNRQPHIATTKPRPHRSGASQREYRSAGWRAESGEDSDLPLGLSVSLDELEGFTALG